MRLPDFFIRGKDAKNTMKTGFISTESASAGVKWVCPHLDDDCRNSEKLCHSLGCFGNAINISMHDLHPLGRRESGPGNIPPITLCDETQDPGAARKPADRRGRKAGRVRLG